MGNWFIRFCLLFWFDKLHGQVISQVSRRRSRIPYLRRHGGLLLWHSWQSFHLVSFFNRTHYLQVGNNSKKFIILSVIVILFVLVLHWLSYWVMVLIPYFQVTTPFSFALFPFLFSLQPCLSLCVIYPIQVYLAFWVSLVYWLSLFMMVYLNLKLLEVYMKWL